MKPCPQGIHGDVTMSPIRCDHASMQMRICLLQKWPYIHANVGMPPFSCGHFSPNDPGMLPCRCGSHACIQIGHASLQMWSLFQPCRFVHASRCGHIFTRYLGMQPQKMFSCLHGDIGISQTRCVHASKQM